jgi:16S rRNA processing protein RimM
MGKVMAPHGQRGLLRIRSYAQSEASFQQAGRVFLRTPAGETQEYPVESVQPHKRILLMKLKDLDTRQEAETYRGAEIYVRKDAIVRGEDEYFWHELLGLEVYLEDGQHLGAVFQIISTGANDVYVVKEGQKELLIPAIYEVIKEVDIEKGRMTVSSMEGLLDLNEV